ncbi:MAG: hypothetical protein ACK5OC_27470 [Pirellula sp.]
MTLASVRRLYFFVCSSLLPRNLIAWGSSRNQNRTNPREANQGDSPPLAACRRGAVVTLSQYLATNPIMPTSDMVMQAS